MYNVSVQKAIKFSYFVTKPGIKMSARCFSTTEKSTIFANSPASVCFSEHQFISIECKIYMDCNGSSSNGEYCAYNETTAPISADCFICHHRYKQRPVSKPVKTHSFETGMPVYWWAREVSNANVGKLVSSDCPGPGFSCLHLRQWPVTYLMTLPDWTMSCQSWPPRARYGQWARYK